MKTQNQLRVKEGRTQLVATHQNKDLTFLHPSYGPNTYANVKQEIEQDNLKPATMAETASLIHAAFNSDDKYSDEIKKIMKDRYFWAFTKSLYVPRGAYIYPDTDDGKDLEESELIKRLEANDTGVRFVPFGYETGEMTSLRLAKNPYVIALAGEEGAEKLAELAELAELTDEHKYKPHLFSFDSVNKPLTRVSALYSFWGLGRWLGVSGYYRGDDREGGAFGVQVAP